MSNQEPESKQLAAADIVGVLDRSGSMVCMGPEPPQAWNAFVREQQKVGGNESYISFYTFNDSVTCEYKNVLLKDAEEYTDYVTEGCTALYDAVRLAVNNQLETKRDKNVVLVVITDGKDNSSRGPDNKSFSSAKEEVKALVKQMEDEHNWQVMYLAADQDAFSVGASYGAKTGKCANFSKSSGGLITAMREISAPIALYRTSSQEYSIPNEINLTHQKSEPTTTQDKQRLSDLSLPLSEPVALTRQTALD